MRLLILMFFAVALYTCNTSAQTQPDPPSCAINNGNCSQICIDTLGSPSCACAIGYLLRGDNMTCIDINECAAYNGNCSHICINTNGSYACSCTRGYQLSSNNRTCSDINECLTLNGGCAQNCTNTNGSFTCACRSGFNLNTDNRTCSPVCGILYNNYDELTLNLSGFTKCFDQPYSHITTSASLAPCKGSTWVFVGGKNSSNSSTIVLGAFGYSSLVYTPTTSTSTAYWDKYGGAYWYDYTNWGFGFSAVPTIALVYCDGTSASNDCAHRLCWNLDEGIGGARIGCSTGLNSDSTKRKVMYKGNQVYTCSPDVNECLKDNGNCSQICNNILGSYYCSCIPGYLLNADGIACTDINECLINMGNCSQICINTNGSYICSCGNGYVLTADNRICYDINDCLTNNGGCTQNCANTNGSFVCSCNLGYTLNDDNKTCYDINECTVNNGGCSQKCTNTNGSFLCSCGAGYSLTADNLTCADDNECASNNGNCSQICSNTDGSYTCLCMTGYVLNVDSKTCNGPVTLIQLRLTEVRDCNYWILDNGNTKRITQVVEENVNAFCSCGFTVYNPTIHCFDSVSITIRGSSETKLVTYFQDWVSSQNSTLDVQGRILLADKNCKVIIQSLNDGACQTTINTALTMTSQVGIIVGAIIAFIIALVTIIVITLALWASAKKKKVTFSNPIYSKGNIEHVQYDTNPAHQRANEFQMAPINTPADAHLYDYATVNNNPVSNHEDSHANEICLVIGNNSSMSNYETIGSSSKGDETCIISPSGAHSPDRNPPANNYDHIGNPFVLHYDTPSNLASTINAVVVENT